MRGRRRRGIADNRVMSAQHSPLIIATRESRLALWQAHHVQALLQQHLGRTVDLLGMTTRGDQILDRALSKVGGKGLFVKELEVALLEGRAHLAVHSLKDVPMELADEFVLAAVLEREDPRDAWVSPRYPRWQDLPQGARVGTSSLRRVVQLKALRPDLEILPLRGNLDTRLRKLDEGEYAGIVLAAAGLKRLGLGDRIAGVFSTDEMLPAAGQGALGLEVVAADAGLRQALADLNDREAWLATHAERAVSRALGGSCSMPLAAHAQWQGELLHLRALIGHPLDASVPLVRAQASAAVQTVEAAQALGLQVSDALRAGGGAALLQALG